MENESKRRKILSTGETFIFIDVWRSKIKDLRGQRKNGHILKEMALELKENYGVVLSAEEVRTRIHNLTKRFRKEKQAMGKSGGSPSTWEFYSTINEFIGEFKPNRINEIIIESIDDYAVSDFEITTPTLSSTLIGEIYNGDKISQVAGPSTSGESSSAAGVSSDSAVTLDAEASCSSDVGERQRKNLKKRNRKDSTTETLLELAREENEIFKDCIDKINKRDEERNEILKRNLQIQQQMLDFLTKNKNY